VSPAAELAPAARAEAAKAVRWLARRNPEAARELRRAIADAARLLGNRPFAGRAEPVLVGPHYRLWSLVSFPYVLVYDPRAEPPQILRLAHTARDLGPLLADFALLPDEPAQD
jgi:toxin ParE1/3/4